MNVVGHVGMVQQARGNAMMECLLSNSNLSDDLGGRAREFRAGFVGGRQAPYLSHGLLMINPCSSRDGREIGRVLYAP